MAALDSSLDAPQIRRHGNFQPVPAPAGFAELANPRLPALEVISTQKRSGKLLKLKRLTRRVVVKPDGRYLIYYEKK